MKPKNFAPLKPNDERSNTTNGNPNFCEGLPIKLEKKQTNNEANIVPKKTI